MRKNQRNAYKKRKPDMCKIMAFAGIKPEKAADVERFVKAAAKALSGRSDTDGFGYAAITKEGDLFGERWLNNADAFVKRYELTEDECARRVAEQAKLDTLKEGVMVGNIAAYSEVYNSFGEVDISKAVAITLHARLATSAKGLRNTHPFLYEDHTTLIHNGVIRNSETLTQYTSTCDSEVILNQYVELGVHQDANRIQSVADSLEGYYSCAVLSTTLGNVPYMDIFKDTQANLFLAKVKELDCFVFTTYGHLLTETCHELGMTVEYVFPVKAGKLLRFDAVTGDVVGIYPFDCTGKVWGSGSNGGGSTKVHNFPIRAGSQEWDPVNRIWVDIQTAPASDDGAVVDDDITEAQVKELLERQPH